jgi:phosphatidate phosphatase APP1
MPWARALRRFTGDFNTSENLEVPVSRFPCKLSEEQREVFQLSSSPETTFCSLPEFLTEPSWGRVSWTRFSKNCKPIFSPPQD